MLRGFSVTNFKSFNQLQSISMAASKIVRHQDHIREVSEKKILKSALIFGANAGGKSNLIRAVDFSRDIVLSGLESVDLSGQFFRIDSENYHKPGVFEYNLLVGGREYSYGIAISYDKQEVISEWLVRLLKNGREFVIFNRNTEEDGTSTVETDIKAGDKTSSMRLSVYFEDYGNEISATCRKKSMLSDIASRSSNRQGIFGEIQSVYLFFRNMIIIFPDTKYNLINEIATDSERKDFFQSVLGYFDTGIESIRSQSHSMDFDKLFSDMTSGDAARIKLDLSKAAQEHPVTLRVGNQVIILRKDKDGNIIYNKLLLNHGNPSDLFDYQDESDGTRRLFDLVPLLYDTGDTSVILIDEIDRSLHTNLVRKFIELFFEKTRNSDTQLIATTQDPNIMDLGLLRQDEIWFVQRENDHSSTIYSLNKFKERFDKVVRNDYLNGRYGAIPMFNGDFSTEEIEDAE